MRRCVFAALLALSLLLAACAPPAGSVRRSTVIFEDQEGVFYYNQIYEVPQGEDLTVSLGVPTGYRVDAVDYPRYSVSGKTGFSKSYDYYDLTLHQIRYGAVIRISIAPAYTTTYIAEGASVTVSESSSHLFSNTLPYDSKFGKEGWLAIGWNTAADGSGLSIGFGSRADHRENPNLTLFPQYLPCTPEDAFTYREDKEGITITGSMDFDNLIIPSHIRGKPVTAIAAGAFGDVDVKIIALPPTLSNVEAGAFRSVKAEDVYLFDNLTCVSEKSFGSYSITHLHINAMRSPTFSTGYFATLADKVDYLTTLEDQRKIVIFCGSSARFGYDSPLLETAFPDYRVVNMGVFAYANMLPQAKLLERCLQEGDVVINSPELDAIATQFCGSSDLDKETFCMMEANYDMLSRLDCRDFTNVFGAFASYQAAREGMTPTDYNDSPANFDEDGVRQNVPTYNRYGDYVLYRENNETRRSFGVKRASYEPAAISENDLAGINHVYRSFRDAGARVFFLYSPRSSLSITPGSTPEAIEALDEYLSKNLIVPVISHARDSLMDPLYFYGTDNHLSTQGVQIYTRQVIDALHAALEVGA